MLEVDATRRWKSLCVRAKTEAPEGSRGGVGSPTPRGGAEADGARGWPRRSQRRLRGPEGGLGRRHHEVEGRLAEPERWLRPVGSGHWG